MKSKICGITNLDDALAAVEYGADALGFNFYPRSPRYLPPATVRAIVDRLPDTILTVGIFVNEERPDLIIAIMREAGVVAAQLHGEETPEFAGSLGSHPVIKALRVGRTFAPRDALKYPVEAILLDADSATARGGTGERINWEVAGETARLVPRLYLAGGLQPANVAEAIRTVRPYAVDVCSGVEAAPGRKDLSRLKDFLAAVRASANASS